MLKYENGISLNLWILLIFLYLFFSGLWFRSFWNRRGCTKCYSKSQRHVTEWQKSFCWPICTQKGQRNWIGWKGQNVYQCFYQKPQRRCWGRCPSGNVWGIRQNHFIESHERYSILDLRFLDRSKSSLIRDFSYIKQDKIPNVYMYR